jgi:hypothetical protein
VRQGTVLNPLFVLGNPDYIVECIPTCKEAGEQAKLPPVTGQESVSAAYAESYGRAQLFKQGLDKVIGSTPEKVPSSAASTLITAS